MSGKNGTSTGFTPVVSGHQGSGWRATHHLAVAVVLGGATLSTLAIAIATLTGR